MVYLLKEPLKGKFDNQYEGPYEITGINYENNNVKLQREDVIKITHINKIKRATAIKVPPPVVSQKGNDQA